MNNGVMTGFDVELMYAVAKTLGLTVKEATLTFESILLGIDDGRYQIGNSSFHRRKEPRKQANFVDYSRPRGHLRKSSTAATFTGLKSLCGFTWRWRLEQRSRATLKHGQNMSGRKKIDLFVVPNPDRSGPGGSSSAAQRSLLG